MYLNTEQIQHYFFIRLKKYSIFFVKLKPNIYRHIQRQTIHTNEAINCGHSFFCLVLQLPNFFFSTHTIFTHTCVLL